MDSLNTKEASDDAGAATLTSKLHGAQTMLKTMIKPMVISWSEVMERMNVWLDSFMVSLMHKVFATAAANMPSDLVQ